jgi:steroid 5-alpha reductase family enzyme
MLLGPILGGLLPASVLLMAGVCLVVSAVGFYRLVFFISIGYGFSVAAMSLVMLAGWGGEAGLLSWVQGLLMAVYGLRLAIYLLRREGNAAYRASQEADSERSGVAGIGLKLVVWLSVSLLYVCMVMPLLARFSGQAAASGGGGLVLGLIGSAVTAGGILIEGVADAQKTSAKKAAPGRFCDAGLYRLTRCPNYFGELLVWTGNLIAGVLFLSGWLQWVMAAAGFACIVLIMVGSTRRLEIRQDERYGGDPAYREYAHRVPVLVPLVPVYSVRNARIYLG